MSISLAKSLGLHGTQEGRHFSAYDGGYGYLPLYGFAGSGDSSLVPPRLPVRAGRVLPG